MFGWKKKSPYLEQSGVPASMTQSDVHLTDDQEVLGSNPLESGNILSLRLIMKNFHDHSLPFAESRRVVVSFWWKNIHKYWLTT